MAEGLEAAVGPQAAQALVAASRPRHYRAGEMIFHQGDPCDCLYLLRSGRVAVQRWTADGEQVTLGLLVAPAEFGEIGILRSDHHHTASVLALEDAQVLSVSADRFHQLRASHPQLTEWLLATLAARLERTSALLSDALFLDADQRIAKRLLDCRAAFGEFGACLPLRQSDIAAMAGVSRPTANRALRQLADQGVVTLGRREIQIVDLDALGRAAGVAPGT